MILTKYETINGKCYVIAEAYDEVLYSLYNANKTVATLQDENKELKKKLLEEKEKTDRMSELIAEMVVAGIKNTTDNTEKERADKTVKAVKSAIALTVISDWLNRNND